MRITFFVVVVLNMQRSVVIEKSQRKQNIFEV